MKTINWQQSNHEIAKQLGENYSHVYQLRKKLGKPANPVGTPRRFNGEEVDWKMSDGEIAQELGSSTQTVWRLRRKLGKKPLARGRRW